MKALQILGRFRVNMASFYAAETIPPEAPRLFDA